jgi:hypothetical protein
MQNEELIANPSSGGTVWLPAVVSALLSGAVSATVGYWLGSRPKSCSCKAKAPVKGVGGEKAA